MEPASRPGELELNRRGTLAKALCGLRRIPAFVAFGLFSLASASLADDLTHRRLRRLGVDEGLSHSSVYAVCQDETGFIWIATQDGLNRYDGNGVTVYRSEQGVPGSVSGASISALLPDRAGGLWVGLGSEGLVAFDPASGQVARWKKDPYRAESLAHNDVRSLFEDRSGTSFAPLCSGSSALPTRSSRERRGLSRNPPGRTSTWSSRAEGASPAW